AHHHLVLPVVPTGAYTELTAPECSKAGCPSVRECGVESIEKPNASGHLPHKRPAAHRRPRARPTQASSRYRRTSMRHALLSAARGIYVEEGWPLRPTSLKHWRRQRGQISVGPT